ncbi:hypothetical protein FB107DRAFT_279552 [Schizophyllum commune]
MPPAGTKHFTALAALTRAKGDSEAIERVLAQYQDAFLEITTGARGAAIQQSALAIIDGDQQPSNAGTSQPSAPAAAPLLPQVQLPSIAPRFPPAPAPAPVAAQAQRTARMPSASLPAMQGSPAPSPAPTDPPATSVTTARSSTTRPLPPPSRPHGDAGTARILTENTESRATTKRKRSAEERGRSPAASEASATGRQLRERKAPAPTKPPAPKKAQPPTRPKPKPQAKGGKGKKKATEAQDETGDAEVDEEDFVDTVVVSKTPKTIKTSRMSVRRPPPSPEPDLVNDPPCDNCLEAKRVCLRRETSRTSHACQNCHRGKLACSLVPAHGSPASDGDPGPSSRTDNPAATAPPAPAASALQHPALYAQDPLGLAQSSATLTELCGHMARFNKNFVVMEALLVGITDFHTYVDQLIAQNNAQALRQAAGGLPAPPPPQAPSAPSRDVSPASQASRKRRRIERDTDVSSGIAQVGGASLPSGAIAGGSGNLGLPAEGAAPTSGETSSSAGPGRAPGGVVESPGASPSGGVNDPAAAPAEESSVGGGAAPAMDVDGPGVE